MGKRISRMCRHFFGQNKIRRLLRICSRHLLNLHFTTSGERNTCDFTLLPASLSLTHSRSAAADKSSPNNNNASITKSITTSNSSSITNVTRSFYDKNKKKTRSPQKILSVFPTKRSYPYIILKFKRYS